MSTARLNLPPVDYFGCLRESRRSRRRLARGLIDAAPLADVVLLLFLFFIVNSSFVLQPGVRVQLPAAAFNEGASLHAMVVTITQEGMVFVNDARTTLEGLGAAFAQAAQDDPEAHVIIEADARVRHGTLVAAYNAAIVAGLRSVTLATRLPPVGASQP